MVLERGAWVAIRCIDDRLDVCPARCRYFQRRYRAYAATHKLPAHQLRAGYLIEACRSAALGGHVQGCPSGTCCACNTIRAATGCAINARGWPGRAG